MHKRNKQKRAAIYTTMRAPYLVENTHLDFVLVGRVVVRRLWRATLVAHGASSVRLRLRRLLLAFHVLCR